MPSFLKRFENSGADVLYSLDGGSSPAMAHRDRLGNNLAVVGTPGRRHYYGAAANNYVNNYVLITLVP
jgi:hypothetical protein